MSATIDQLITAKLVQELRQAAAACANCQGTRETTFTSRGRDNIVNCLHCEPIYKFLEPLELALDLLKAEQLG
jgi:hypothetical protein